VFLGTCKRVDYLHSSFPPTLIRRVSGNCREPKSSLRRHHEAYIEPPNPPMSQVEGRLKRRFGDLEA
jgi:hypothetical protein